MERHIVHCDLDTFFVSVERLQNTALIGKPVLIGGSSDRGVVASCSYEARKYGVHSAMPMRLARQLCPDAILVRGDMDQYSKYSAMVTEIISEGSPLVEKASIDEHYIDVSGMDKFFGCWKWTKELRQRIIRETGLPISFGLSINKTVSKIATGMAKPSGEWQVQNGTERSFLAPLSIKIIPMVGAKTYTQLRNMGISKIKTLQEMEVQTMARVLGQNGVSIWKKANALDNAPVIAFAEQKSMSKEHTFEIDTIDMVLLRKILITMIDELAFDLRKEGKLTACIALKIRYSNFDTHTKQEKISYTSSERVLTERILELFAKLYSRRMLIRLVGIKLSNLVAGSYQVDLFDDGAKELNLSLAMDHIRTQFGTDKIMRAVSLKGEIEGKEKNAAKRT
jgi:DNA polymerase-4